LFNGDHTVKHTYNTKPVTDAQHIVFVANANFQHWLGISKNIINRYVYK